MVELHLESFLSGTCDTLLGELLFDNRICRGGGRTVRPNTVPRKVSAPGDLHGSIPVDRPNCREAPRLLQTPG